MHRPKDPVLLAVDQEFGEGACLRVPPIGADPVGAVEVGEHQDVEQLGAGSRAESLQTLLQSTLKLVGTHEQETTPSRRPTGRWRNSSQPCGSSWTRGTP
jgi:hypothetical protein